MPFISWWASDRATGPVTTAADQISPWPAPFSCVAAGGRAKVARRMLIEKSHRLAKKLVRSSKASGSNVGRKFVSTALQAHERVLKAEQQEFRTNRWQEDISELSHGVGQPT